MPILRVPCLLSAHILTGKKKLACSRYEGIREGYSVRWTSTHQPSLATVTGAGGGCVQVFGEEGGHLCWLPF